jgi:glycosyltransferase involved in cell wall biosynthesis
MKILHVIDHFSLGGAQRIVEGILHALPESMLLPLRKKGDPHDQIAMPENRILLKPRGSLVTQLLRLLRAPGIVAQNDFQIVHCHLPYSWLFGLWLYLVLPARNRPALVFHEHDSIKLKRWYYPRLARAAHRAGTLVAVSRYVQHQIASHGTPLEDIRLLHNYIDLNRFSPGDPHALEQLPRPSEAVEASHMVGFAGRLVAYKGWQYIIQAAARLRQKNIRFVIAGVGPDAAELERQIEAMNLHDSVIPLGYVAQMVDFYRSIDILVIPSQREAFGLVQLEAQACGIPVILFESQAALELSGDQSTVIVPYGDIDALVEIIEHLLTDKAAYALLVQKGLENARNYDLAAYLNKLEEMYTGIVTGKDRP